MQYCTVVEYIYHIAESVFICYTKSIFWLYCGDFHAFYMKASNLMHLKKIRKCRIAIECALIRKKYMKYPKYSLFCIAHLASKTIFDQRSIFLIISLKIRIRIKIRIPFMSIAAANILFFFDGFAVAAAASLRIP